MRSATIGLLILATTLYAQAAPLTKGQLKSLKRRAIADHDGGYGRLVGDGLSDNAYYRSYTDGKNRWVNTREIGGKTTRVSLNSNAVGVKIVCKRGGRDLQIYGCYASLPGDQRLLEKDPSGKLLAVQAMGREPTFSFVSLRTPSRYVTRDYISPNKIKLEFSARGVGGDLHRLQARFLSSETGLSVKTEAEIPISAKGWINAIAEADAALRRAYAGTFHSPLHLLPKIISESMIEID